LAISSFHTYFNLSNLLNNFRRKEKEESALMKEDAFIRQAMILTAVSTLVEIFGHLYISTIAGLGYIIYVLE
jgi:hypothetical protein